MASPLRGNAKGGEGMKVKNCGTVVPLLSILKSN